MPKEEAQFETLWNNELREMPSIGEKSLIKLIWTNGLRQGELNAMAQRLKEAGCKS